MQTLDLHGIRHHQADDVIRRFLNFATLPCQVITGNSYAMRHIVKNIVQEYEWFCHKKDSYNYGTLIVTERNIR